MSFNSPLRYPGGKSKLNKQIMSIIEMNDYRNGTYIEPFAGGAGIALALLYNDVVDRIIINDLDTSIYCFWKSVISDNDNFVKLIEEKPVTIDEWRVQKSIQDNPDSATDLELGFSTFFLNRTNVSGIIKGGIIGGYNQTGKYKIDARYNKNNLIDRIRKIGSYQDRVDATNLCVKDLINTTISNSNDKYFIYFDPPYYIKGPELYNNHLLHEDHLEISSMIKNIDNHYWIVTYDNVPEIVSMYGDFRQIEYSLNYSIGKATKGKEVMVFSNNLELNYENDDIKIIL